MSDERNLAAKIVDHGLHVAEEKRKGVMLNALGLIALVVTPQIHCGGPIFCGERVHLVAKRVPIVGKAVNEKDRFAFAERDVVNLDIAVFGRVVINTVPDVRGVIRVSDAAEAGRKNERR